MSRFLNINRWNAINKILFIPIILVIGCLFGYLLLVLVYCIPVSRLYNNVYISSYIFERESAYPQLIAHGNSQLDNYTDALMILAAAYPSEDPWTSAVNIPYYSNGNPYETLVSMHTGDDTNAGVNFYNRYWHGYLVILKPLLVFSNYATIRFIIIFVELGLFTLLIKELAMKDVRLIFPAFIMWIFLNPVATMMSLQFNSVFIIILFSLLTILHMKKRGKLNTLYKCGLFFMLIGAVTSYVDLLTYPMTTLGIPLILWFALDHSDIIIENTKKVFAISIFWLVGYSGMWGCKWLLGSILTGNNLFKNAFETIRIRTSSSFGDVSFVFIDVIKRQAEASRNATWKIAFMLAFVIFIYKLFRYRAKVFHLLLPYAIIATYPLIWYAVLKNHSFGHYFFTYRESAISLYAATTLFVLYPEQHAV